MLTTLLRLGLTRSMAPFEFRNRMDQPLPFEDLEEFGLYVHIPFCRTLCSFCPYCKEIYDPQRAGQYKESLLAEIELAAGHLRERRPVTSLYFGGGTPALMGDDLAEIIAALERYFEIRGGIGVELHPSDLTAETLTKLKSAGVTMVSLGIQSFERDCLEKLGRSWEPFADKVRLVHSAGFDVIDVDLIFAIPGQTEESLTRDIQTAFANGATQVSTYPFIDFTFAHNTWHPMSDKDKLRLLKHLAKTCKDQGLVRTSVWTFAKPGTSQYSSVTREAFLGFGLSATSLLRNQFKINTHSLDGYVERISQGRLATSLTLDFTSRQRAAYFLFWSCYGLLIDPARFQQVIGQPLAKMYGREIWLAQKLGILRQEGTRYRLTDRGMLLYHQVEQIYTTAYIDRMWNISRIQAFPQSIRLR